MTEPPGALARLRAIVAGEVLAPGDPGYDQGRRVWNGSIDRHPAAIVRCTAVDDVVATVEAATTTGLPLAVRGGGHNVAGFGTCDGGIVADLSGLRGVVVDPVGRTARAGGGARWGDVDAATGAFGLAVTGGQVSTTGIGGLTLGGGIGWLMRKYGLACDNLLSAEVVLADGRVVTATADNQHADLFWGLRGGGGNFGVVTSFEYRLHPVRSVLAGAVLHPRSGTAELLHLFRDFATDAPDEVSSQFGLWTPVGDAVPPQVAGMGQVAGIEGCWCGQLDDGEKALAPVREFGDPLVDDFAVMPYPALQKLLDPGAPFGMQNYAKAEYLRDLSDDAIAAIADAAASVPSPASQLYVTHLGGAVSRVGEEETAFSHRAAPYLVNILSIWVDPAEWDEHVEWARAAWASLRPFSTGGAYVNFLGDEGLDRVRRAYSPSTYARLVEVKRRYDPTNLFVLNQNIPPTAP